MAQRAALELRDGDYVNLGFGLPNLIANYLPDGMTVYFHSENGILGMGPRSLPGEEDFDVVDAMKVPVTLISGATFFNQLEAHLMTRGGHLDLAILGAFQVSEKGDIANWKIPGSKGSGGIGGAMDIAVGDHRLIALMEHTSKDGQPKIVRTCTYPVTALGCVNTIITDVAVVEVTSQGLELREVAPGWTPQDVQAITEPRLIYSDPVAQMHFAAQQVGA
jgi:3-oxoacid CoA-transferase B subunit